MVGSGRPCNREGDAQNRVGAKTRLVRCPVKLAQLFVQRLLVVGIESVNGSLNLTVHMVPRIQNAFASVSRLIAVTKFDSFTLAGGCTGWNFCRRLYAVRQSRCDRKGWIASGVEDFECFKFCDLRHDDYAFPAIRPMVMRASMNCC